VGGIAPRTATAITVAVLAGFALVGVTYVLSGNPPPHKAAGAGVLIAALLGLQLAHTFPAAVPSLARHRKLTLAAQAMITFVPFLFIGKGWLGVPGFLGGSCLLILPSRVALPALAAVVAGSDTWWTVLGNTVETTAYVTIATLLTSVVVYGMTRLVDLVWAADAARSELARLAVSQERLRFARDLQPVFGTSLAAISNRCKRARRYLSGRSALAAAELTEALLTARQTLADVRSVASGYREMSLTAELASAQSILAALDIGVTVTADFEPAPGVAETALAMVLRDGLAEVLRHDTVRSCAIEVSQDDAAISLRLTTDVSIADRAGFMAASRQEVAELGGELTTSPRGDSRPEITVTMPRLD
jgi:two-component system sensor histidine kinase DesK